MGITYPYNLQEGTVAYARHVMANFNAIINALNNLQVAGIDSHKLEDILTQLVVKNAVGNADEIVFDDGETMQKKLDDGDLNGRDATLYDGYAQFHIASDGHLHITVPTTDPDFTINGSGHLILTVKEESDPDTVEIDLGKVKGDKGDTGPAGPSAASADVETVSAAQWEDDSSDPAYRTATVSCDGITATNNFIVQPHVTGVEASDNTAAAAWDAALVRVISQTDGEFVLYARGTIPTADIPIDIIYDI